MMKLKKSHKESIGILLGVLAALVILFSQSFYFDYLVNVSKGDQVEQIQPTSKEDGSSEIIIKMSHQAISPAIEIAFQNVLHFITQIYTNISIETPSIENRLPGLTAYFQALFRLIISPNAP